MIALAAGSKLNGALTAPVYALVLLLAAIRIRDGAVPLRRRLSTVFMVIGMTALPEATGESDQAIRCVRMALEVQRRVAELGTEFVQLGALAPMMSGRR